MIALPGGTMMEVLRGRDVSAVMVLERDAVLPLRPANYWERFRFWWRMRRQSGQCDRRGHGSRQDHRAGEEAVSNAPDPMRGFARDQLEAVKVLREEKAEVERDSKVARRVDACHLAMRYLDDLGGACSPPVETVIATARKFEKYLTE